MHPGICTNNAPSKHSPLPPKNSQTEAPPAPGAHYPSASSFELRRLYSQHSKLRGQLRDVYIATINPSNTHVKDNNAVKGRGIRISTKRNQREIVAGKSSHNPCTQQKALKSGLHSLRKMRQVKGGDGEGWKQFSRLITQSDYI